MIKRIKVMLLPNNKQKTKMFQYGNASKFAYNWALGKQIENYKNGNKIVISDGKLRKEFTEFKKENEWLYSISNNVMKQSIKDCCDTYFAFVKGDIKPPRFKSKKKNRFSFYQDTSKIKFSKTHVKLEGFSGSRKPNKLKINWIRLAEKGRIPFEENIKYTNPRITFDGLNWWISVGIEYEQYSKLPNNNGINIFIGEKYLAVCSDGYTYENINNSRKIKKIEKKRRKLQKRISKKYLLNKKGNKYIKTKNIIKSEKTILKMYHKSNNIYNNYIHQVSSDIIGRKPMFITLDDTDVYNKPEKDKLLRKIIWELKLYKFKSTLKYKADWNNITFNYFDNII